MGDNSSGSWYFCYLTISNQTELIIQSVLLSLSLLLIGDAFRKFWKMRATHNSDVSFIYRLILVWWTTYILANAFGLTLFSLKDHDPTDYSDQQYSTATKYYFVLDWVNAFSIQWLLLYVPYHWARRITDLFCLRDKGSEAEFTEDYKGYERKIYPALKYYTRIRLFFFVLPVVFLILDDDKQQILFKAMVSCLLVDCMAITISLIFGMISLKTTEQLKLQLDEDESKRMFNQYLMIIFANSIRFGFDLTFVISKVFGDESYSATCPDNAADDYGTEIAFNICTCILTHYLPIFIILRIYNLEEKPIEIGKSLLVSGDYDNHSLND